jgi:hypothetical protein
MKRPPKRLRRLPPLGGAPSGLAKPVPRVPWIAPAALHASPKTRSVTER